MTIEQRLTNLENLVNALSKKIDEVRFYEQADIDGARQNIEEITPYTETKTGYYGETEKTFYNVPDGNVTVYGLTEYTMDRVANNITLSFDALEKETNITVSIL